MSNVADSPLSRQLAGAVLWAACLCAGLLAGCGSYRPLSLWGGLPGRAASLPTPAPRPPADSKVEFAVRTLRLQYSLPGWVELPVPVSWEQIDIADEAGRPCPVRNIAVGKAADGYWTALSFAFDPNAHKITARLVLAIQQTSYPLAAVLTRIDETHWRVDYGILPGDK